MMRSLLWLLICVMSGADAGPLKVMSAPNVLRVGAAENIFVECQDCGGHAPKNVRISVWNDPTQTTLLASTTVNLNSANSYQALGQLVIPPDSFDKDPTVKQYVYLQAAFPQHTLEKVVLVSFQAGHLFIQTDKSIYTPGSTVNFRVFGLSPKMEPIGRLNAVGNPAIIVVEIVTPEDFVIPLGTTVLKSGVYTSKYQLDDTVSLGQWKVVSRFYNSPWQSYSAEFEVQKYALPSYEVKLTPESPYYYYDANSFKVSIQATYVLGKQVDGMAYVLFGVVKDGQRTVFPASLQRILIIGGNGEATLQKDHITRTLPHIIRLVGGSLFVTVMVYTESGSEMVKAELINMPIVTSPYLINFDKTPTFFRAGQSFDVTVTVTYPDGSPAEGVSVLIEAGQNIHGTTGANGRAHLRVYTRASDRSQIITARTNDNRLPTSKQASESMVAKPHEAQSRNSIHIRVMTADVKLEAYLQAQLTLNSQSRQYEVTYLIMSRGQLVGFGRQPVNGQEIITLTIPVTKKLLPSFRLIVYFHPTPTEVVSDSVWVDVDDASVCTLRLEPQDPAPSYEPHTSFNLRATGDPGATVLLVGVDKGIHVLNKNHLLTQKKVWEVVEKADTGCTPGGGPNSMGVFFDAGLLFQSDTAAGTPSRQDLKCPHHFARKKRASTVLGTRSTLDGTYTDSSEIITRTRFPESSMWVTFQIPVLAGNRNGFSALNTYDLRIPLQDSTTTWVLTGISLSKNDGICVGKPLDVVVFKQFSIDLRLPYSAMVGEQVEIKAILHNYIASTITVRIELIENTEVCSSASKHGRYTQLVTIAPSSTRAVPFVIIPMREGGISIEVKAAVRNSPYTDGVMKRLLVMPTGVLTKSINVVILDPRGDRQDETINNIIPITNIVPNTPSSAQVFLTGRKQVVQNVIDASSMGSLIYAPTGNGEVNMDHMSKPVIAMMFLDKTNQWEAVGLDKRTEAINHIKTGVQNQVNYIKADGSFTSIMAAKGSTWLTAFGVKIFTMVKKMMVLDKRRICNAVNILTLRSRQQDDSFKEVGHIIHREFIGDLLGTDSDASMTAFCLIALQESQPMCNHLVRLHSVMEKAVAYLERRLPSLTNPYAVTMSSYALANAKKLNKETLYRFASPDMTHWISPKGDVFSLEATAYALLALVKGNFLEEARPVVRWLTSWRRHNGGYGSTQATVVVYQALSEYWTEAKQAGSHLAVELSLPGHSVPYIHQITQDNYHAASRKFRANENVKVTATGTGAATLTLVTHYYTAPSLTVSDCTRFNLSMDFSLFNVDETEGDVYRLKMDFYFKNNKDSSMSILDITLPTGFIPMNEDLNRLSQDDLRSVVHLEYIKDQSEKGSIILFLQKVSHSQVKYVAFRMRQTHKVDIIQPASVSIYEYGDETRCVRYYHPHKKPARILRRCNGNECVCAEGPPAVRSK